jgi:transcriptional regulator with XRE-family HTH domain
MAKPFHAVTGPLVLPSIVAFAPRENPSEARAWRSSVSRRRGHDGPAPGQEEAAMVDPAVPGSWERDPRPRPLLRTMLGEVLRRARLEQGRTLADVAREARVSMPYLSELERGRKEASSEVLAAICEALGVELSDVLADVGSELAVIRVRQAQFVRLEAIREQHGLPPARGAIGSSDMVCLLAA